MVDNALFQLYSRPDHPAFQHPFASAQLFNKSNKRQLEMHVPSRSVKSKATNEDGASDDPENVDDDYDLAANDDDDHDVAANDSDIMYVDDDAYEPSLPASDEDVEDEDDLISDVEESPKYAKHRSKAHYRDEADAMITDQDAQVQEDDEDNDQSDSDYAEEPSPNAAAQRFDLQYTPFDRDFVEHYERLVQHAALRDTAVKKQLKLICRDLLVRPDIEIKPRNKQSHRRLRDLLQYILRQLSAQTAVFGYSVFLDAFLLLARPLPRTLTNPLIQQASSEDVLNAIGQALSPIKYNHRLREQSAWLIIQLDIAERSISSRCASDLIDTWLHMMNEIDNAKSDPLLKDALVHLVHRLPTVRPRVKQALKNPDQSTCLAGGWELYRFQCSHCWLLFRGWLRPLGFNLSIKPMTTLNSAHVPSRDDDEPSDEDDDDDKADRPVPRDAMSTFANYVQDVMEDDLPSGIERGRRLLNEQDLPLTRVTNDWMKQLAAYWADLFLQHMPYQQLGLLFEWVFWIYKLPECCETLLEVLREHRAMLKAILRYYPAMFSTQGTFNKLIPQAYPIYKMLLRHNLMTHEEINAHVDHLLEFIGDSTRKGTLHASYLLLDFVHYYDWVQLKVAREGSSKAWRNLGRIDDYPCQTCTQWVIERLPGSMAEAKSQVGHKFVADVTRDHGRPPPLGSGAVLMRLGMDVELGLSGKNTPISTPERLAQSSKRGATLASNETTSPLEYPEPAVALPHSANRSAFRELSASAALSESATSMTEQMEAPQALAEARSGLTDTELEQLESMALEFEAWLDETKLRPLQHEIVQEDEVVDSLTKHSVSRAGCPSDEDTTLSFLLQAPLASVTLQYPCYGESPSAAGQSIKIGVRISIDDPGLTPMQARKDIRKYRNKLKTHLLPPPFSVEDMSTTKQAGFTRELRPETNDSDAILRDSLSKLQSAGLYCTFTIKRCCHEHQLEYELVYGRRPT
eukprot:TRINITY_DN10914_c0_g1_i1.p1 TRINITY_DN10914_c0_g1~~TRINITY_DN10914_c0_g1_i1.p1  ORF type:complete len:1039 (+),score=228.48 TRINITY_DN10914_c0_g1_i1:205-3117(+)